MVNPDATIELPALQASEDIEPQLPERSWSLTLPLILAPKLLNAIVGLVLVATNLYQASYLKVPAQTGTSALVVAPCNHPYEVIVTVLDGINIAFEHSSFVGAIEDIYFMVNADAPELDSAPVVYEYTRT
jgi:hypothetical protein